MVPVTFLMPVYNVEKYIAESIESLLAQTYSDFEILIINDGSTDKTQSVIDSYLEKDSRIKCITRENRGLISSLNEGFEKIDSKYIARMDGDDLCHPQRLEFQMKFMEENPDVGLCGTNMRLFDKVSKDVNYPFTDGEIKANIIFTPPFCHGAILFRKDVIDRYNLRYDADFVDCEDYKLWLDLSDKVKFANLPLILYFYRRHGKSVSDLSTCQKSGAQLIRRIAVSRLGLSETSVKFHLDYCAQRYENLHLEYWPVYLKELISKGENYKKAGFGHFKVFCEIYLPKEHIEQFYNCVIEAVENGELEETAI